MTNPAAHDRNLMSRFRIEQLKLEDAIQRLETVEAVAAQYRHDLAGAIASVRRLGAALVAASESAANQQARDPRDVAMSRLDA